MKIESGIELSDKGELLIGGVVADPRKSYESLKMFRCTKSFRGGTITTFQTPKKHFIRLILEGPEYEWVPLGFPRLPRPKKVAVAEAFERGEALFDPSGFVAAGTAGRLGGES